MKANHNGLHVNSLTPIRDAVSHLTRLDDFNVVKLSAGFFSEVFKVTHISTKKVMVLKMNKHPANRSNALKEIELLNKLNHPNVVAFMGTVVHEGQLHPLLEYLNYGTLENLIKRFYPISITEIIPSNEDTSILFSNLAKDVAEGMSYLHNHNYMHRDLTSRNVLIRRNADAVMFSSLASLQLTAVIADFGFAITEPLATDPKLPIVGSPYWLAPECLKDQWYNHKCDIFSFGVICCELNWKIPADPDYLPRDNDFLILYDKLPICLSTTILAKIAQLATNENCSLRPEFSDIICIFKENDDFMHTSDTKNVQTNTSLSTTSSSSELDGGGDVFDQHLIRRRNSVFNNESRQDP